MTTKVAEDADCVDVTASDDGKPTPPVLSLNADNGSKTDERNVIAVILLTS